ncbi:hypothetical protein SELMODRAFT_407276 [Selaginella moellendorffii]|uniref:Pentacotripeptide-repeat region of PRORP domain-containing protein n=1 Tax=Selaginella moellendorffii TaxID=88036 RepID=D8R4H8_SELML|nr:hypothetical protein SELMODRAFT_407276 [Selaginella moellendorffii]
MCLLLGVDRDDNAPGEALLAEEELAKAHIGEASAATPLTRFMAALRLLRSAAIAHRWQQRIASAGFFTRSSLFGTRPSQRDEKHDLLLTANVAEASLRREFPQQHEKAIDDDKITKLLEMIESKPDTFEAVKKWMRRGNCLSSDVLSTIYFWLMKRKRYTEIMKLLEGIRCERLVKFTDMHCVWAIGVISRRRGMAKAERFYDSLPEKLRTDRVTVGLFLSVAKENGLAKAEQWLEKIQVHTTDILDVMMVLYLNRDKHHKVVEMFERMRGLGLQPSVRTYLMLLKCKDRGAGGLNAIEGEALGAVQTMDVEDPPLRTLNDAMEVYGYVGKQDGIEELWRSLKRTRSDIHQSSYFSAITALGLVGEVAKARALCKELLAGSDEFTKFEQNPHALMLEVYARNGMMEKAERILQSKELDRDSFAPYNSLIQGYMAANNISEALKKLDDGLAAVPAKSIRLQYKTMMVLLPVYAANGDVEGAKELMRRYTKLGDAGVYNEFLKVYISRKRHPREFMERMQANGVEGNRETEKLLEELDMSPEGVFKRQMEQQGIWSQWVRAFSSESSGSSSVSRHAQVLPVWPVGTETRFSQMMYVGEAGKSIDSYKSEDVSDFCEMLLSKPDIFQGLKEWVREGNTFSSSLLSKVYYRLAKRKEENMAQTTQTHYIWEMDITCRQQSTYAAEIFYNDIIPARFRSEVTAALIFSLAKRNALAKSEKWIEQMTVLSTDLLNMLMALYFDRDKHDKVLETYERMSKLGLEPSINTYLMLLTYKDKAAGGLEGIEGEAEEEKPVLACFPVFQKTSPRVLRLSRHSSNLAAGLPYLSILLVVVRFFGLMVTRISNRIQNTHIQVFLHHRAQKLQLIYWLPQKLPQLVLNGRTVCDWGDKCFSSTVPRLKCSSKLEKIEELCQSIHLKSRAGMNILLINKANVSGMKDPFNSLVHALLPRMHLNL